MVVPIIALPPIIVLVITLMSIGAGIEWFLPGGITMVIILAGFTFYSFSFVSDKSKGILRRISTIPTSRATYIACESLVTLVFSFVALCVLLGIMMGLGVRIEGSVISFTAMIFLGALTFMALGAMTAGFIKSEKVMDVMGNLLTIMLIVPSFVPPEAFLPSLKPIVGIIPSASLSYVLRDLITGCGTLATNLNNIGIILVWLGVCGVIAAATFRWE